jgi:hypothetical protein
MFTWNSCGLEYKSGRQIYGFESEKPAPLWKFVIPGYIIMPAFKTIYIATFLHIKSGYAVNDPPGKKRTRFNNQYSDNYILVIISSIK